MLDEIACELMRLDEMIEEMIGLEDDRLGAEVCEEPISWVLETMEVTAWEDDINAVV